MFLQKTYQAASQQCLRYQPHLSPSGPALPPAPRRWKYDSHWLPNFARRCPRSCGHRHASAVHGATGEWLQTNMLQTNGVQKPRLTTRIMKKLKRKWMAKTSLSTLVGFFRLQLYFLNGNCLVWGRFPSKNQTVPKLKNPAQTAIKFASLRDLTRSLPFRPAARWNCFAPCSTGPLSSTTRRHHGYDTQCAPAKFSSIAS